MFKGLDTRTGDCVAIKQLSLGGISQDNLAGIMGEIELLKNINHPNIVKYVGSFKTRTHLYIILEFMENGALSSVIKPSKFGAFPESLAAVYIAQVAPAAGPSSPHYAACQRVSAPSAAAPRRCCRGWRTCTSRAWCTVTSRAPTS